jgi:type IV pilus assembly protein PilQ
MTGSKEGNIMASYMIKYKVLKLLALCAVVCISYAPALAGGADAPPDANAPADANMVSDQTSLEQRLTKKISVEFRKTAIEDVLRIMADQANIDIVKSPKVEGEVTVTLTDVPLEEALNNILSVHGFTYVLSQNMIRVITNAEQIEKPEVLQSKTFEIVYADVTEVVKALDKFKSPKGSVSQIKGSSYVIVTDTETKVRDITLFIEKIDVMTQQVLVEVRIYDIISKNKLDLGVEWNVGRNTGYYTGTDLVVPPGTMGNLKTGDTEPFSTGMFRGATSKTAGVTGQLKLGWLNNSIDIDMLIKAQQNVINAKLLANPRILVLDNETAKINIVSEIPYQKLNQGGGTSQSFGTTEFKEVGVTLEVTPHIAQRDEMIRLKLKPSFSVQTGSVDVGESGKTYPQPVVDKREADTVLLIKNGQTVVLGGLRKKDVTRQVNKVPLLGDLPLAGPLFRFKGEDTIVSEIVVFITPHITEQPVLTADMSDEEKQAYAETNFKGPKVTVTKAEKEAKAEE